MESYGIMGKECNRLIKMIAAHSKGNMTPAEFKRYAVSRLSVTLQTANANLSLLGQQQLHLAQHSHYTKYPAWRFQPGPGHAPPISTEHLHRFVTPELNAARADAIDSLLPSSTDSSDSTPLHSSPLTRPIVQSTMHPARQAMIDSDRVRPMTRPVPTTGAPTSPTPVRRRRSGGRVARSWSRPRLP